MISVVLSRKKDFEAPDCLVFDSLENCLTALELAPDQKAFIIGNVCMDTLMTDVTDINCKEGDKVIIFNHQKTIQEFA